MQLAELSRTAQAMIASGQTREEVFTALVAGGKDNPALVAYAIAAVPTEEKRKRYVYHNALLTLLLCIVSVLTFLAALPINFSEPTLFLLLKVGVPLVGVYFTFHFHGGAYRLLFAWLILDLFEALLLLDPTSISEVLRIPLLLAAAGLALLIGLRVFPQLKLLGGRRTETGAYILE